MQLGALEYLISVNDSGVKTSINRSVRTILDSAAKSEKGLKDYGNKISAWTIAKGQMIVNATTRAVKILTSTTKDIVKKSVMSYADHEQLTGGVETMFKKSADQVKKYAEIAYKTAGISANQYMETVTSFSASLLQSLEGDTDKAADYADMAVKDMADNANKMGSSMESIQNAYQGFAKQNYTMLDNLKLGYGGTKTEMERLLTDAGKLVNRKFDIKNLSDVYEAIHVIQQEMGIFGTTQKEAEGTISGSINMMKASWSDLMTSLGSGKNVREVSRNFTKTVKTVLTNITPVAKKAISNIFTSVKEILPELKSAVKDIWRGFKESLGDSPILNKLADKAEGLVGFFGILTDLLTNFDQTTDNLINSPDPLLRGFGKIAILADKLIGDINAGIEESGSLLLGILKGGGEFLTDAIDEFATWLNDGGAKKIADIAVKLVDSLATVATELITPISTIISKILTDPGIQSAVASLLDVAGGSIFNIFVELAANLAESLGFNGDGIRKLKLQMKEAGEEKPGSKYVGSDGSPTMEPGLRLKNGHVIPLQMSAPENESPFGGSGSWLLGLAAAKKLGGLKGAFGYTFLQPLLKGLSDNEKAKENPESDYNKIRSYGEKLFGEKTDPFSQLSKKLSTFGEAFEISLGTVGDFLSQQIETLTSSITTGASDAWENTKEKAKQVYNTISGLFSGMTGDMNIQVNFTPGAGTGGTAGGGLTGGATAGGGNFMAALGFDSNGLFSSMGFGGKAKGDWNVPYDNFPALLHRNEMVLTASQARRYRDGGDDINYAVVGEMIGNAVESAMSRVYVMMSGDKVGDLTTKRVRNNMNANSYSKLRALGG